VPTTACHDPDSGAVPQPDSRDEHGRTRPALVALIGPPNSGKTTLYNQLTGLRQKVANYPGVTQVKVLLNLQRSRVLRLLPLSIFIQIDEKVSFREHLKMKRWVQLVVVLLTSRVILLPELLQVV
jgi:Fe2+ transport system protein B